MPNDSNVLSILIDPYCCLSFEMNSLRRAGITRHELMGLFKQSEGFQVRVIKSMLEVVLRWLIVMNGFVCVLQRSVVGLRFKRVR